jgi:hypothetical protein
MTLPPQIELRARCAKADDLSGIIFRANHRRLQKPIWYLLPEDRRAWSHQLTAKEIEMQFTDHWEMALMDYNGSLEDANELVTIHLWDPRSFREHPRNALVWELFSYERTRWNSRREWFDYMASCRNDQFTFDGISIGLSETTRLYVSLRRAVAPQAV